MSLYVLDTDVLSLYRNGNATVMQHVSAHSGHVLAVAVVSAKEMLRGWLDYLPRQTRPDRIAHGFAQLAATVTFLGGWPILPYQESTITLYQQLRSQVANVGSNDLRIAAIALEQGAVVVTRNLRDFNRIPGVTTEDWGA